MGGWLPGGDVTAGLTAWLRRLPCPSLPRLHLPHLLPSATAAEDEDYNPPPLLLLLLLLYRMS